MHILLLNGMVGRKKMGIGNRLHGIKRNKHGADVYRSGTSMA
jgi:hypothetical protein